MIFLLINVVEGISKDPKENDYLLIFEYAQNEDNIFIIT
jgi:hypothetical protein